MAFEKEKAYSRRVAWKLGHVLEGLAAICLRYFVGQLPSGTNESIVKWHCSKRRSFSFYIPSSQ